MLYLCACLPLQACYIPEHQTCQYLVQAFPTKAGPLLCSSSRHERPAALQEWESCISKVSFPHQVQKQEEIKSPEPGDMSKPSLTGYAPYAHGEGSAWSLLITVSFGCLS